MRKLLLTLLVVALLVTTTCDAKKKKKKRKGPRIEAEATTLQIGVKVRVPRCEEKAHNGDRIRIWYMAYVLNGDIYDTKTTEVILGAGELLKGCDLGIAGMCVGEKRKIKIPPHLAFGEEGDPDYKVPGNKTVVYEVHLQDILERDALGKTEAEDDLEADALAEEDISSESDNTHDGLTEEGTHESAPTDADSTAEVVSETVTADA